MGQWTMAMLLVVGMQVAEDPSWVYQPAGRFPDPGPCESASRIGDIFAAACRLGVWVGPLDQLELVISCPAEEEFQNRVRVLDQNGFIASTACGMYLIDREGEVDRLPFPSSPVALDADGNGRAAVSVDDDVWIIAPRQGGRRLFERRLLQEELVEDLVLLGGFLLARGEEGFVAGSLDGSLRQGASFTRGLTTLLDPGRLFVVDPQGCFWIQPIGQPVEENDCLPLVPAEKVVRAVALGRKVLILTFSRWWLLGGGELRMGQLPPVSNELMPVREFPQEASGGPPWLVGAGELFQPVGMVRAAEEGSDGCQAPNLASVFEAAVETQGLHLPPAPPCLAGFLPEIGLSVFGDRARKTLGQGVDGWGFEGGSRLGVFLRLGWALDRPLLCENESTREQLLLFLRREQDILRQKIAGWLAAWVAHCRNRDRLALEEVSTHLNLVTDGRITWPERFW